MVNIIGPWFKFLNLNHTSTIATQYPQSQPPSSPKKLLMNTTSNSSSYSSTSLMCVTKVTRSNDNFIRQLSLIVVAISCFTLLLSVANFIKSLVASRKINKPNHSSSSTMNALSPDWSSSKTLSVYTTAAAVGVTTSPSLTPTRLQFRIEILAPVIWFITCTVCLVNAGMEVSVVSNLHSATKCVEMMTMTSADDSNSSSTSSTPASSLFLNPHPSRAIVWLGLECYAMLMVMVRFDWIRRQNALFVQRQQQLQLNPINDDKKLSIMNHLSSTQTKTSLFFQWGLTVCIFALFNFGIALELVTPSLSLSMFCLFLEVFFACINILLLLFYYFGNSYFSLLDKKTSPIVHRRTQFVLLQIMIILTSIVFSFASCCIDFKSMMMVLNPTSTTTMNSTNVDYFLKSIFSSITLTLQTLTMFGIHAILPHKFLTSQCDLSGTAGKIAAPTSIPNRSTSFGEIEEVVEVGVSLNSTMNAARKQVLYVHDDVDADSVCASVCDEGSEGESDLEEEKDDDNLVVFRIE